MAGDTVLIGGIAVLILGAVIWVLLRRLDTASMTDRIKRLVTYFLIGTLAVVVILVMRWHAQTYIAETEMLGYLQQLDIMIIG